MKTVMSDTAPPACHPTPPHTRHPALHTLYLHTCAWPPTHPTHSPPPPSVHTRPPTLPCPTADAVVWLLLCGASASATLHGGTQDTALHYAAAHGRQDILRVLLAFGANYHARNTQCQTPAQAAHQARHTAEAAYLTDIANGKARVPDRQAYTGMTVAWERPEGAGPDQARARLVLDLRKQVSGSAGAQHPAAPAARGLQHDSREVTGSWEEAPRPGGAAAAQQLVVRPGAAQHNPRRISISSSLLPMSGERASHAAPDVGRPEVQALQRAACARGYAGLGTAGFTPHPSQQTVRVLCAAVAACCAGALTWQALRALATGQLHPYSIVFWLLQALALALGLLQLAALWRQGSRPQLLLPQLLPEAQFPSVEVLLLCSREPVEVVETAAKAVLNMNYPGSKLVLRLVDTRGRRDVFRLTRRLQFECK